MLTSTFLFVNLLSASNLSHGLSNQGYTGIINTPNAQVMNEGDLTIHFDNQFDNVLRGYDYDKSYNYQEDYIFGAGLFPYFEIQGRLAEIPGYARDLSANLKFQLPYKNIYLPNVAFGFQDLGSAANHYGNKYIVMDKELWFVRASLGYGKSDGGTPNKSRMDGVFGGLEVKTFDWLYLLAEDDSREQFAGIRLEMPKSWSSSFKLSAMITSNVTNDYDTSMSVNLTFPLYENTKSYSDKSIYSYVQNDIKVQAIDSALQNNPTSVQEEKPKKAVKKDLTLQEIKNRLVALGMENITIATKDSNVYLAYENGVFLFNDLDALGVAIGLLTQTQYKTFTLEQKRSKMVAITIAGDLDKAREFYKEPNVTNKDLFSNSLTKISPLNLSDYTIVAENENDSSFKPKIEFKPKVTTFIGNEFGVFNYMLWLRTQLQVNLAKGIDFTAVGDIHIKNSEIDDHRYDYFTKLYEKPSHMESVMLHISNNLFGGVNTLSFGTLEENFSGLMEQYIYNYGNHTIKLKGGYFEQFKDGDAYKESFFGKVEKRKIYLAKYSYLLEDYDTLAEINLGQYWNQDQGFDVKIKRYFGDVAVYLQYEQNQPYDTTGGLSEATDRYAGLGIEIPLTLKHTPLYRYGQIRGTNAFDYRVKSTIAREDGSNKVVPGGNYNPEVAISSENYFYNRNRLQLSYVKTHAFRLKNSYEEYVK